MLQTVKHKSTAMAIHFQCPGCLVKYSIPEGEANSVIDCPICEARFKVPVEEPSVLANGSMSRLALKGGGKEIELQPVLRRRRIRVRAVPGNANHLAVTVMSGFLGLLIGAGIPMVVDLIFLAQKSTVLVDKPDELAYSGYQSLSPTMYALSACLLGGLFAICSLYWRAGSAMTLVSGCLGLLIGAGIPMLVDFISLAERQALVETNPDAKTYFGYHPPILTLYAVPGCILGVLFASCSLYWRSESHRRHVASPEHHDNPTDIRLQCPGCRVTVCTEALKAGSVLECPTCRSIIIVPENKG